MSILCRWMWRLQGVHLRTCSCMAKFVGDMYDDDGLLFCMHVLSTLQSNAAQGWQATSAAVVLVFEPSVLSGVCMKIRSRGTVYNRGCLSVFPGCSGTAILAVERALWIQPLCLAWLELS